jgi:hypothetical protein
MTQVIHSAEYDTFMPLALDFEHSCLPLGEG